MASVELLVRDVVSGSLQLRYDTATACMDGENAVTCAMRDVDSRTAVRLQRSEEAGGEREHMVKSISFVTPSDSAYDAPSENPPRAGPS